MEQFMNVLNNDICDKCCNNTCIEHNINVSDIVTSVNQLKADKHDGSTNFYTDHIKNGTHKLYVYISLLFSSMIKHNSVPEEMLMSTLIPLIKNKRKSASSSDNNWAIALSSALCKLLDNVILNKLGNILATSELQFGFKKKHSTVMCTFVVDEVIQYYTNMNTPVNVC